MSVRGEVWGRARLESWIAAEEPVALRAMLRAISATDLEHHRPDFCQVVRPVRGSVLASPVSAHYDPEPDYFFHWLRDAAVVMGAVSRLMDETPPEFDGAGLMEDMAAFALALDTLDGRALAEDPEHGAGTVPEARQFLRPPEELAGIRGDRVRMETRVNPDGTLDILRWARPQLDGAALRAVVLLEHEARYGLSSVQAAVLKGDLAFTLRHAGAPGFDIWEERDGQDYYTLSLQQRALDLGAVRAARADGGTAGAESAAMADAAQALGPRLDAHWSAERACYRARLDDGPATDRDVDMAVVLAALHSGRTAGTHSIADPRILESLETLCGIFAADYGINRASPDLVPALGRFRGDVYQSGGAFHFSTLGAAEVHYRLAALAETAEARRTHLARGDGFMGRVARCTPRDGSMAEQFDQADGHPASARHLTWSYAAFLTAALARKAVVSLFG